MAFKCFVKVCNAVRYIKYFACFLEQNLDESDLNLKN